MNRCRPVAVDPIPNLPARGLRKVRAVVSRWLLATFGSSGRSPFSVGDLGGLDEQGQALIGDWCAAVQAVTAAT